MASTLESRLSARVSRYETNPASRTLTRLDRHSGDDTVLPGATARRMERSDRWADRVAMRSMGMPSTRRDARRTASFRGGGYRKLVRQFGDSLTDAAFVGELPPWLARVEESVVPEEVASPWYTPRPFVPAKVFWWGADAGTAPAARTKAGALSRASGVAPPVRRLAPSALPLTSPALRRAPAAGPFAAVPATAPSRAPTSFAAADSAAAPAARSGWRPPTAVRRATQASAAPLPIARAAERIGSPLAFSRGTGRAATAPSLDRAVARFESARPSGRGFAAARTVQAQARRSFGAGFSTPDLALPNLPAAAFGAPAPADGSLGVVDGFSYPGRIDHGPAPVSENPWYTASRTPAATARTATARAVAQAPLARAAARTADPGTSTASTPAARIAARAGLAPSVAPARHGLTRQSSTATVLSAAPSALFDSAAPAPASFSGLAASSAPASARSLTAPAAHRSADRGSRSALSRMTDRSVGRAGPAAVRQATSGLGRRQALLSTAALAVAAPAPLDFLSALSPEGEGFGGITTGRPLTWNAGTSDAWASSPDTGPAVTIPLERSGTRVASRTAAPATTSAPPTAARTVASAARTVAAPVPAARRAARRTAPTAVARAIAASTSAPPPVGGALGYATARATSVDHPTSSTSSPAARSFARGVAVAPLPSARPTSGSVRRAAAAAPAAAPSAAPSAATGPARRRAAARAPDLPLPQIPLAELAGIDSPKAAPLATGDAWAPPRSARAARSTSPAARALARFDAPAVAPSADPLALSPLARSVGTPGVRALARFGTPGEADGGRTVARSLSVAGGLGAQPTARRSSLAAFDPIVAAPAPASLLPGADAASEGDLARSATPGIASSPWGPSPDTGPAVVIDANAPTASRRAATRSPLTRAFDRAGVPTAAAPSTPSAGPSLPGVTGSAPTAARSAAGSSTVLPAARAAARMRDSDPIARRPRPLTRAGFDAPLPSLPAGLFGTAESAPASDGVVSGFGDGTGVARGAGAPSGPWGRSPDTGPAPVAGRTAARPFSPAAAGAAPAARSATSPTHRTASRTAPGATVVRSSMGRALARDARSTDAAPTPGSLATDSPLARRPGFRRSFSGGLELPSFAALPPGIAQIDDAPLEGGFGASPSADGAVTASPWYTAGSPAPVARAASRAAAPGASRVSRQATLGGAGELPSLPGASPAARSQARRAQQGPRGLSRALQRSADLPVGIAARSPLLAPDLAAPLLPDGATEAEAGAPAAVATGWSRAARSGTRTTKAARSSKVGTGTLASLKGLRKTDGIPEEFGTEAPAHDIRPVADASSMVARAARRLASDTRAARRASTDLTAATPIARSSGTPAEPRISRAEVGTMVSRRIAEELTTISAPAPGGGISGKELRRQVDEQLAREATPSTQQSGGAAKSKDIEDAFRRAVRRIFKEEQIRGERDLTPFG